jgi:hypothetical protein
VQYAAPAETLSKRMHSSYTANPAVYEDIGPAAYFDNRLSLELIKRIDDLNGWTI